MNQHLQTILDFIQQAEHLSAEEKAALLKAAKNADKELEITSFKLERTEKVKHTTAILLEETIEELEQKRKAVEAQNRELEIESALERVRSVALAMKGPDDMLDVCKVIATELNKLDVKEIRNVQTAIFYETKGVYINYEFYAKHDKTLITEVDYSTHTVQSAFADQMMKGPNEFFTQGFTGKEVQDWYAYQKTTNVFLDSYLEHASSLNYYWYSLGPVALGMSTYLPLSEEQIILFQRFRNVFGLAYRRYLDIEQALAQAKEARIETSLERVRAVAMAMKQSGEVINVSEVMYKELVQLGFANIRNAQIAIKNDTAQSYLISVYSDNERVVMQEAPYKSSPIVEELYNELGKSGDAFFQKEFSGKKLNDWRKWREGLSALTDSREATATSMCFYLYSIGNGHLGISTYNTITEEQITIIKRFKNVFELSYQRYTDVAKAEAQARESRIEMALERVRAVAMAMRKPDELALISTTIYTELTSLDFSDLRNAEIIINNDSKETIISYYSDYGISGVIEIDYKTNLIVQGWANELRKANDAFVEIVIPENEMDAWRKYREEIGYLPDAKLNEAKTVYYYSYSIGLGALSISSFRPITKEQIKILERFRNVFKLSYQRYIDIEQAEAQAREAQIQLALERVRARTMAMQHSDELQQAAKLLFQQVKTLGLPVLTCGYNIWEKEEKVCTAWMSSEDGLILPSFTIPLTENETFIRFYESRQKGESFYVFELSGEALAAHYKYMLTLPAFGEIIDGFLKSGFTLPTFQINHVINFSHGNLIIVTYQPVPEAWDVFKRFTAVFEQTYTRFLDLQKAEAQAREAQIELALERVRARTMAMYRSDELSEVVYILFQQFKELGENPDQATIGIINEDEWVIEYWVTMYGNQNNKVYKFSIDEPNVTNRIYRAWKEQKKSLVIDLIGQELHDFTWYRASMGGAAAKEDEKRRIINVAFFSKGLINVQSNEERSAESIQLLERFAGVFDLTYTRFLDLQKAEAQARESQIEVALERVRSRTMSMQHSNELAETAFMLFQQVKALSINVFACGFNIWIVDEKASISWMSNGEIILPPNTMPHDQDPTMQRIYDASKYEDTIYVEEIGGSDLVKHYEYIATLPFAQGNIKTFMDAGMPFPELPSYQVFQTAFFKQGYLMFITLQKDPEYLDIFTRFAKVFEQTYTRFLDLQKAEAQSRESQIQLALERARTQSMIMQHSNELDDTLRVFHAQVLLLELPSAFSFLWLPDEDKDRHIFWAAWAENNSTVFKSKAINYPLDRNEPATAQCLIDWKSNEPVVAYHVAPASVKDYFVAWDELITGVDELKPENFSDGLYYVEAFMKYGCFGVIVKNTLPEDEKKILNRFAVEFERAYTRFLDLQKAEAQAREGQVQLALERVRARTMAMQHSDELPDAANILFQQIQTLGMPAWSAGYCIWDDDKQAITLWMSSAGIIQKPFRAPVTEDPSFIHFYDAWKRGETFYVEEIGGNAIISHYQYMLQLPVVGEMLKQFIADGGSLPTFQIYHLAFFSQGFLLFITYEPVPEAHDIFKRFAKVFEQTYTRFLDLQKAEAQAREAEIELGLERVRARAMAMQKSDELSELVDTVFKELTKLDFALTWCIINIIDESSLSNTVWAANPDINKAPESYYMKFEDYPFHHAMMKGWKERRTKYVYTLEGQEKKIYDEYLFNETEFRRVPVAAQAASRAMEKYVVTFSFSNFGGLQTVGDLPLSDTNLDILSRFGKVFDLTYTRFNDLKNAEAQARESQIQLALERVRARTMAMQHSDELKDAAALLFQQVKSFGVPAYSCGYNIWEKDEKEFTSWMSTQDGSIINGVPNIRLTEDANFIRYVESKENGEPFFVLELRGERMQEHYQYLKTIPAFKDYFDYAVSVGFDLPKTQIHHLANFSHGNLLFITLETCLEFHDVFKRFATVFEQTYTRFLDLQKAEAQAREAKIEAAMEKVRSRAMAMQKPAELVEVAQLLRKEMNSLGVEELETSSIYIHHEEAGKTECWYAIKDVVHPEKELVSDHMTIDLTKTWVGKEMLAFYHSGKKQTSISMQGTNRKEWINYCAAHSKVLVGFYGDNIPDRTYHLYKFSNGYMGAASPGDISTESWDLLQRATSVFSLAYTRFSDLQQAEAQAREANIETALERVRSRTLAMQRSEELAETAAVLFKQLILLGIEPNRLYINIIRDETGEGEFWITDEDGSKVSSAFAANMNNNDSLKKMYEGWKEKKKSLIIDMQGNELQQYFDHLTSLNVPFKDGLTQKRRIQHIAYFSKGFIGMASPDEQPEGTTFLLERFAGVFNLTFTRFNDLKLAEAHALQAEQDLIALMAAKKKAEDALTELKATQSQLIQSEKMASLGELTAGIAHEIQNPLNFVNNFSEVNAELIEELKEELKQGNTEEVMAIANDIKDNEEKINHHGKRADAIVKGMLQHSRSSSAIKEPTDINKLADEYLRLAYHGLRAKDKSFNATLVTDYDETISNINIIPQDIGRVILNLIMNAFYTVAEKKKQTPGNYEPTVSVATKKTNDAVEIKVADNGNGIPQKVLDKIFQPFFTTKPTGQGTGLGLSLAYDIIKVHGGEIKVETKDNEGSVFTIQLPIA